MATGNPNAPVRLIELESKTGTAEEMDPIDRARLRIAINVLGVLALFFLLACLALIYGPSDRVNEIKAVFEFVKTMAPPIATLVIGFYFRTESA